MNGSQSTAASGWTDACIVATMGRDQRPDRVASTSVRSSGGEKLSPGDFRERSSQSKVSDVHLPSHTGDADLYPCSPSPSGLFCK